MGFSGIYIGIFMVKLQENLKLSVERLSSCGFTILTLKIRNVGGGIGECRWGMGRDSGKCLHQLDVLWVCGQPHIPVVASNYSCKCSKCLFTCRDAEGLYLLHH